jgi:mRNA interferase HicA
LERELKSLGFWQVDGGKHDKWTNGVESIPVPRHREINEFTAKGILKSAKQFQKEKK